MKRIFTLFTFVLGISALTFSQIRTVSNATNSPGQYQSLQDAINAANPGDTLYLHGSSYGSATVNKRLTFIGPGFNAQGQFTIPATIPSIILDDIVPTSSATGSTFIGLNIGYIVQKNTEQFKIDSITFENCRFYTNTNNYVLGNFWVFKRCLFQWGNTNGTLILNNYSNIFILNSVFATPNGGYAIRTSNQPSVDIRNCLFTGHFDGTQQFLTVSNATFANNIFFGKFPYGASNSTFMNNKAYGNLPATQTNMQLPYGNNVGQNNLVDTIRPGFTSIPIDNSMYSFSYNNDYRLLPTSPCKNAGSDGTDMGIFGGAFPISTHSVISCEPYIPQIYYMQIQNNVIDQNTPLDVTIKARKMN